MNHPTVTLPAYKVLDLIKRISNINEELESVFDNMPKILDVKWMKDEIINQLSLDDVNAAISEAEKYALNVKDKTP